MSQGGSQISLDQVLNRVDEEESLTITSRIGPLCGKEQNNVVGSKPIGSAISLKQGGESERSFADRQRLDKSFARGIAWTGAMKWLAQVVSWLSTLIIARLLTPEDYGLVGMALVYVGLVTIINEFGFGAAIVFKRELTDHQISQLNTLSVMIGLTAFAISCAAAIPLSNFYGAPQLRGVVMAMSLTFIISAFQTVPNALLQKDLEFKWLGLVEGTQAFLLAATMVLLAILGFGYWTLVLGNILGTIFTTILTISKRPHPFAWPRPKGLGSALKVSGHILTGRVASYAQSNADLVVAGRMLGQTALGVYTFGFTLANVPVDKISALMSRVAPAHFSAVQNDLSALRRYLLRLTEALALITFPMACGLAVVSDEFVLVLLGEKWHAVANPLRILAILASLRSIGSLPPHILNVTGLTHLSMKLSILGAIVLPPVFWLGSRWGTIGIAWAWLATYPILALPLYFFVFKKIELKVAPYFKAVWPALSGSVIMSSVVMALKLTIDSNWSLPLRLGIEVFGGVASYFIAMLAFHRARIEIFFRFLREIRR